MAILLMGAAAMLSSCSSNTTPTVEVFYKEKEPSLRTLERTKDVLQEHEKNLNVTYYIITEPENKELLQKYNFPESHFPFAVVIDGKYTALIDDRLVQFVDFPLFMKGIGKHEGNWSMDDLAGVLANRGMLRDKNVLPESVGVSGNQPQ
ncbi:hypothetical protein SMSP2_02330 [Limihaloglobus sulfuriphilus]|uniref:Uncharacterized protein n=2 Tax=Limihaloglobus sulfuriphilus TaxID=1851148 RepID=A0A1Q2MGY6_9BACT|nr:hypothetical protein SMSP2_02330 [Limihaloglobus sulfuriphilus]